MAGTQVSEYLPYVRRLQEEHRKIGELVDRIQAAHFLRDRPPAARGPGTDLLLEQLRSLRSQLQVHFAEEETGGAMEEAIGRLPRLATEWNDLEAEHRKLLEQLDGIIDTVQSQGLCGHAAEAVKRRFHAFAECLYEHEVAENRLLHQGFNVGLEDHY